MKKEKRKRKNKQKEKKKGIKKPKIQTEMNQVCPELMKDSKDLDHFVDMIPPTVYLSNDLETEIDQYNNKKRKSKEEKKEEAKEAKKLKFDPKHMKTTTELQKERLSVLEKWIKSSKNDSSKVNELKEKLHQHTEERKKSRKIVPKDRSKYKYKKELRKKFQKEKHQATEENTEISKPKEDPELDFGTFVFDSGKPVPAYLKELKKQETKKKPLTKLLKEAEQMKLLEEKLKETEEGKKMLEEQKWKKLMDKATGIKLKDDPKLLKKTLKQKQKKKKKSAIAWQERKKKEQNEQTMKQMKRNENIQEHLKRKKEVKLSKRKGRLGVGFEGRVPSFINEK